MEWERFLVCCVARCASLFVSEESSQVFTTSAVRGWKMRACVEVSPCPFPCSSCLVTLLALSERTAGFFSTSETSLCYQLAVLVVRERERDRQTDKQTGLSVFLVLADRKSVV